MAGVLPLLIVWKVLPALAAAAGIGGLLLILFLPYWIPTIVAIMRSHPSKGASVVLKMFLEWTVVGWVVALVWALSDHASRAMPQTVVVNTTVGSVGSLAEPAPNTWAPLPQYQPGDVVNGHRFDGVSWIPLQAAPPGQLGKVRGLGGAPSPRFGWLDVLSESALVPPPLL